MSSLKDFAKTQPQPEPKVAEAKTFEQPTESKQMDEGDVRAAIGHFSKMSNDQLMGELVKQIAGKRERGEMQGVKDTIERIKPFLDTEQKAKLANILKQLNV